MNSIFFEIKELFCRERVYRFLLILIIFFYAGLFFLQKSVHEQDPAVTHNLTQMEELLRQMPGQPELIEARLTGRAGLYGFIQIFTLFFVSAFGVGIWFGASDLMKWLLRKEVIPPAEHPPHISWGISEVIRVIILFFAFAIALSLAISAYFTIAKLVFHGGADHSLLMLAHTFLLDVSAVFLMVFVVRSSGGKIEDLLGFRFPHIPLREIWWGTRTYFVILPLFMALLISLVYLASRFSYEPPPHPLVEVLLKDEKIPAGILWVSLFIACILGPIVEEIFFRGFFYPAIRRYWNIGWAMCLTAGLFALMHESFFAFLPIFFLGLALCYLYEKRANLISCISLHMLHNTTFIIYFFLMRSVLLG
ncbi:MAG: CPBP family intramembrane metalloprotease [Candidatus Omnitrophica bacterium]|nr:CPBP family intramembrane metalloprotease [Candidatus Omnitrophota bacterium]